MKVSFCLSGLLLCSALLFSHTFSPHAQAESMNMGKDIYTKSCMSCHKSKLAGKQEDNLLKKFDFYAKGDFTSGAKKTMKDLFMKMSDAEKASLAKYIHEMK